MSGRLEKSLEATLYDYTREESRILTCYLEGNVSNHVFRTSAKWLSRIWTWIFRMLDKALNQCTIQFRGCNATQSGCEGSSPCCFKPSPCLSYERTARTTRMRVPHCTVQQDTLFGVFIGFHSPVDGPIAVPNNSAKKGEGIIGTSGQNCSQIPRNITWRESKKTLFWLPVSVSWFTQHTKLSHHWTITCIKMFYHSGSLRTLLTNYQYLNKHSTNVHAWSNCSLLIHVALLPIFLLWYFLVSSKSNPYQAPHSG